MEFTLDNLPEALKKKLLVSHVLINGEALQKAFLEREAVKGLEAKGASLFALAPPVSKPVAPKTKELAITWGTDNYLSKGARYAPEKRLHDTSVIVPRAQKAKAEQKRRSKEKAEVFTPSWVCNKQNNLVDEALVGVDAFNTVSEDGKSWSATEQVSFSKPDGWARYLLAPVLEITCGEAPYLVSPYDTVSGEPIPLRDGAGNLQRIGLLDRKLRVATENLTPEEWSAASLLALQAVYGYEWQGDNLALARLNILNSLLAYYEDAVGEEPEESYLLRAAEIISYNLFQLDGLKMVLPGSCSAQCKACAKRTYGGHDGVKPALRLFRGGSLVTMPLDQGLGLKHFPKS